MGIIYIFIIYKGVKNFFIEIVYCFYNLKAVLNLFLRTTILLSKSLLKINNKENRLIEIY